MLCLYVAARVVKKVYACLPKVACVKFMTGALQHCTSTAPLATIQPSALEHSDYDTKTTCHKRSITEERCQLEPCGMTQPLLPRGSMMAEPINAYVIKSSPHCKIHPRAETARRYIATQYLRKSTHAPHQPTNAQQPRLQTETKAFTRACTNTIACAKLSTA